MDSALIAGILGIVAALIPLIGPIIAIFGKRKTPTIDNPALKILGLKRCPLSPEDLQEARKPYRITLVTIVGIFALFYIGIIIFVLIFSKFNLLISAAILIIEIVVATIFISLLLSTPLGLYGGTTSYNGPKNLNTGSGGNKIYSTHDEKALYSRIQSPSSSRTAQRRENTGPNCR